MGILGRDPTTESPLEVGIPKTSDPDPSPGVYQGNYEDLRLGQSGIDGHIATVLHRYEGWPGASEIPSIRLQQENRRPL